MLIGMFGNNKDEEIYLSRKNRKN